MSEKVSNLYFLPNLKEQLITRSLQCLDEKRYDEVFPLLHQALEVDPSDNQAKTLLLTALHETNQLRDAKNLALEIIKSQPSNYLEVVDIYILVLVGLKEYENACELIDGLFHQQVYFSDQKRDQYLRLLEMNERLAKQQPREYDEKLFLSSLPIEQQVEKIGELNRMDIYPYVDDLRLFLSSEENNPFVKTMALMALSEQGYTREVEVQKNGTSKWFVPRDLKSVFKTPLFQRIDAALREKLEHNNPSAYQQTYEMMQRHFYLLYPYEMGAADDNEWIVAYLLLSQKLYGDEINPDGLLEEYGVTEAQLLSAQAYLDEIDKISLPNI